MLIAFRNLLSIIFSFFEIVASSIYGGCFHDRLLFRRQSFSPFQRLGPVAHVDAHCSATQYLLRYRVLTFLCKQRCADKTEFTWPSSCVFYHVSPCASYPCKLEDAQRRNPRWSLCYDKSVSQKRSTLKTCRHHSMGI